MHVLQHAGGAEAFGDVVEFEKWHGKFMIYDL
jgi:hypothetical protein